MAIFLPQPIPGCSPANGLLTRPSTKVQGAYGRVLIRDSVRRNLSKSRGVIEPLTLRGVRVVGFQC